MNKFNQGAWVDMKQAIDGSMKAFYEGKITFGIFKIFMEDAIEIYKDNQIIWKG